MADKKETSNKCHTCPFCDAEIAEAAFPYCEACGLAALRCPKCEMVVPHNTPKCPHCGADIRRMAARGG